MTTGTGKALDSELQDHIARRTAILGRVRRMLIRSLRLELEPTHIDPDTPLFGAGLGLDSIDSVEVVVALKSEFGVELTEARDALSALRTVNTMVDVVLAHEGGAP